VNPHTGQPVPPDDRAPADPSAAGAAFQADRPGAGQPEASVPAAEATTGTPAPGGATAPVSPSSSAPSPQEIAVRAACETVMDPEIGLSAIDLGLIREVHFLEGPKTLVKMMLTTPFCPYAPQLMADVKAAAESAVPQPCEVEILPDAWSPDLMPDPGLLGFSY
jgi:metal-sulfur cluster biosynthetic enzyme